MKSAFVVFLCVMLMIPAAGSVWADSHESPSVDTEAAELRATLDQLFSEHAYLAITAMRKGYNGDGDFDQTVAALNNNTDDLTTNIENLFGESAGNMFNETWSAHIGYFVDYVTATAEDDAEGKMEALANLAQYKEDFSAFLSGATNIPQETLASNLQTHIDQLIGAFDAYVDEDYNEAYMMQSDAMQHMYGVSKALSQAIATEYPEKVNETEAVTPAIDLRSDLNFLLSEHFGLALQAMQNGYDGAEEFDANAAVLGENTEELAAAIEEVYGEEGGEQFETLWSNHIGYFVDYVQATAMDNEDGRQAALDELDEYRQDFSTFMENASGERIPADTLAAGLQTHVDQLVTAFDSYVNEDYGIAWMTAREGYMHMFTPAKIFSSAIVNQFPEAFMEMDNSPMFEDVPEDYWGAQYIYPLVEQGVINGFSDTMFKPGEHVTRAQFTAFVVRSMDLDTDNDMPFTDVSSTFYDEVAAAYDAGITNGVSETEFYPNAQITREQMAAMIMRAYEYWTDEDYMIEEDYMYADEDHISPLFDEYVDETRELGIMVGNNNNEFNPKMNATRAEAAKVVFMLQESAE
ncbi:S-layer homology domain-containing protein [Salimicrobium halophilum]|nr:S-layer homology domain-containing protein [Salimicrobium halophilum]